MTRMQEMSLDYHFKVEQEVSSSVCAFFGFNGEIQSGLPMILSDMVFYPWHLSNKSQ